MQNCLGPTSGFIVQFISLYNCRLITPSNGGWDGNGSKLQLKIGFLQTYVFFYIQEPFQAILGESDDNMLCAKTNLEGN